MASSRKPAPAEAQVRAFLERRLNPNARLCLGYSGGLDSTVLLHILAGLRRDLGFRLEAMHVHHGLSPNADHWAEACSGICAKLDIPLTLHKVAVTLRGDGLEAAARAARYHVFETSGADAVVLAHHLDDQVETFFLRLLRGAGVDGLAAMAPERVLGPSGPRLLRPLLDVPRAELRAYADLHALVHCEDESNQDVARTRNFLRQAWLPNVAERVPAYRQRVALACTHLRETSTLLADLAALDASNIVNADGVDIERLLQLGPARARNLLRHWLAGEEVGKLSSARLNDLLRQLMGRADAQPSQRLGGLLLRRQAGKLILGPAPVYDTENEWVWRGEAWLSLGGHGALHFAEAIGEGLATARLVGCALRVRLRAGGERLQPDCRRPRRQVKKLLREHGVPAWERPGLPVLWVDDGVAWVARLGVDCRFQAQAGEPGRVISWHPPRR
jgi:tRNA(Ile)-lysidine synthase